MSLLFLDSFDDRTPPGGNDTVVGLKYSANNPTGGVAAVSSMRTGKGVTLYNDARLRMDFSSRATYLCGWAIRAAAPASAAKFWQLMDSGADQVYLRCNTDLTISLVNGSGAAMTTSSSAQKLSPSVIQYIEVLVTVHNTAGAYTVKVDGVTWLSATGVNTRNTANNTANQVQLAWSVVSSGSMDVDDYYIADDAGSINNTFLGPVKIECLRPNAVGNTTQLSPTGAANNWDCVNDTTPDDDSTYVADGTVGHKDTYGMTDLAQTAGTVCGVQSLLRARKDDLSTRQICAVYRSGGNDYDGSTVTLASGYADYLEVKEANPDTTNPWTIAEVNAAEMGLKIVA